LTLWFRAIWYITVHKHGGNALGLQRELGLGSYHTAWEWLHKLRKAMIRPDRDPLVGLVEVDETYIGGVKKGKRGRGAEGKSLVMVAVEDISPDGIGRIRLKRVPDASGNSLTSFIKDNIAPDTEIHTDGWAGYNKLEEHGYSHVIERECEEDEEAGDKPLKLCHMVISLFKRQFLGVYQGAIHPEQLDRYLEEFTFRFNRRHSTYRGLLFQRVIKYAVAIPPFPAKEIALGLRSHLRDRTHPHRRLSSNEAIRRDVRPPPLAVNWDDLPF
jgi:transposase-like protein